MPGHYQQYQGASGVCPRACESLADADAFDLLVKSGFRLYEAGAAFCKTGNALDT
jgi:hypothetical protein